MVVESIHNEPKGSMSVSTGKKARRMSTEEPHISVDKFQEVEPLNYIQGVYLEAIRNNNVVFGIGSAGTGKTYISTYYAASQLFHRNIEKIIVTRPNIEVGRGMGFIPGTIEEKYAPYIEPFDSIFSRSLGRGFYDYCIKNKSIDPKPIGFMRGITFDNCMVLVDEAQNITKAEMKMLLSRIGKNCKMILSGDPDQSDIPNSGLIDAVDRLSNISNIEVVEFLDSDIVRSKLCKQIIMAYNT